MSIFLTNHYVPPTQSGLKLIQKQTLTSAAAQILFSGLSNKKYIIWGRYELQNNASEVYVDVNSDATLNHYNYEALSCNVAVIGCSTGSGNYLYSGAQNHWTSFTIEFDVGLSGYAVYRTRTYIANSILNFLSTIKSDAAITNYSSIAVRTPTANGFKIGTEFSLYEVVD